MISLVFKTKNRKIHTYPQTTYYGNSNYNPPVTPQIGFVGTSNHVSLAEATTRAAKLGISTPEWQRRDAIVRRKYAENTTWKFMDTFYPSRKDIYEEVGRCWFVGAVSSYKEIDHSEWPEDDKVLIFTARPCKGGEDFICNIELMSKTEPT